MEFQAIKLLVTHQLIVDSQCLWTPKISYSYSMKTHQLHQPNCWGQNNKVLSIYCRPSRMLAVVVNLSVFPKGLNWTDLKQKYLQQTVWEKPGHSVSVGVCATMASCCLVILELKCHSYSSSKQLSKNARLWEYFLIIPFCICKGCNLQLLLCKLPQGTSI